MAGRCILVGYPLGKYSTWKQEEIFISRDVIIFYVDHFPFQQSLGPDKRPKQFEAML